jgi:hypothetical protein
LRAILGIVKAVKAPRGGKGGRAKLSAIESLSLSFESDNKLYQVFSPSFIALLYSDSSELGGREL